MNEKPDTPATPPTVELGSSDLFGVLEQALRDGIDYKSGARLSDYEADITEAIRRARRMDWWIKNATAIAKERGELFRAGERMSEMLALAPMAQVADWPTDDQIMGAVGAWNAAAQPIRDMVADLSSPNDRNEPRHE